MKQYSARGAVGWADAAGMNGRDTATTAMG